MARDSGALTDECEYFDEPDLEMKRAARRTIAVSTRRLGISDEEAVEMMKMCGVHTSQTGEPEVRPETTRII